MSAIGKGRILVTDAQRHKALAIVRSLGKRGFYVTLGSDQKDAVAFSSKYCAGRIIYPNVVNRPQEFLSFMLAHLKTMRYDCFIPTTDETIELVACHKEKFAELTNIVVVDGETIKMARDKRMTIEFARARGFTHPKTVIIDDIETLSRKLDQIVYPAVIKPRSSCGGQGLIFVKRPVELLSQYLRVHHQYPFPLIQECIPQTSPKYQVCCLFNRQGQVRAAVVQQLHRQYPVRGGPGTCFETVDRPDLRDYGVRLLELMRWQGVACVELLEDERDHAPKLMEVNPRFWGTLALAIQSGVDFPYLLYKIATDGDVEPQMDYRVGEVCRWMLPGEILHFFSNLRRLHITRSFWRFRGPNLGYCILSCDDVRPVFAFFWVALKSLFDKKMRDFVFRRTQESAFLDKCPCICYTFKNFPKK